MADPDYTVGDAIGWIFTKIEKWLDKREKKAQDRREELEKERQQKIRILSDLCFKASLIAESAQHHFDAPYGAVTDNLIHIVNACLTEAQHGIDEEQYILNKIQNIAHCMGCDLVKKE